MNISFKCNRYTTKYFELIRMAQNRRYQVPYGEKHHIVPKFCGGKNTKSNKVVLTIRNHFRCHKLLIKMVRTTELLRIANYTFWMMCNTSKHKNSSHALSLAQYQNIREIVQEQVSKHRPGDYVTEDGWKRIARNNKIRMKGKKPHNYGKSTPQSIRDKISEATIIGMDNPEVREKISKPKSKKHRKALSRAALHRKKYRCKYCNGMFSPQILSRWHGNRCPEKRYEEWKRSLPMILELSGRNRVEI